MCPLKTISCPLNSVVDLVQDIFVWSLVIYNPARSFSIVITVCAGMPEDPKHPYEPHRSLSNELSEQLKMNRCCS